MADFALWATACETDLWPAGTFTRAYSANRKAAIEGIIDADPIAACVREFMSERSSWTGSAADLLRVSVDRSSERISRHSTGAQKSPRLAGHLRRAQTFLRALGIEIAFSREGRGGSRVIRMRSSPVSAVTSVSSISENAGASGSADRSPGPVGAICNDSRRSSQCPPDHVADTAADGADGADGFLRNSQL
jgi:hypothetical protein